MDCFEDEDEKATGVQNILQTLEDNECQQNTVSSTDNSIAREPDELKVVNLEQQNTNFTAKICCIEEFVEKEYIENENNMGTLNFLKTLGSALNEIPTLTTPCVQNFDRIQFNENIFYAIPNGEVTLYEEEISNSLTTAAKYDISIESNLDSDHKTSEFSVKNNRPIRMRTNVQENDNIHATITSQQCDLVSSSEINVEGEDVRLEKLGSSTHLCTYDQVMSNDSESTRHVTNFMREEGGETVINQRNETKESGEIQAVDQSSIKSPLKIYEGSSPQQMHLIKPQNFLEQQNNQQMSDPCSEFMDIIENSKKSQKRKFSTIFPDNEQQFLKASMLRSFKIQNRGSSSKQFIQTAHLDPKIKSLQIHKKHTLNQPSTSNLKTNPLKSHETDEVLQSEPTFKKEEYDERKVSNTNSECTATMNNENTLVVKDSVCSKNSTSDGNTYSPPINWSFIRNETETVECKILTSETDLKLVGIPIMNMMAPMNTGYLLRTDTEETDERNTLVTTTSQQHELDSSNGINEERKDEDLHMLGKSANLCTSDQSTSNDSGITTHLTDFKGEQGAETDMNQKSKIIKSTQTQGIYPSSIKSPLTRYVERSSEQTHPIKPQILEHQRNQQKSDSYNDFINIIENSETAHKRKFSTILFDTEPQSFKASMLRTYKISNRGISPKHFNQTNHLNSKTKSLQICKKLAVTKPSTSSLLTNPTTNLEIDEVCQSESDDRSFGRDEQIESNKNSECTATISDDNGLVCHIEDYISAHKSKSDGHENSPPRDQSFNRNEWETAEYTTLTSEKEDKPVDTFIIYPTAAESPSQSKEYETILSSISNAEHETECRILESSHFNGELENIPFGSCATAVHIEPNYSEISPKNNALEETCNFSTNFLSKEPILRQDAKRNSLYTAFSNTSESEATYKLIKIYIENLRVRRFTVQNVVNFITEQDPSISYFNAMHATRIFLKNALKNEILRMNNGNYLIKTSIENPPYPAETHTSSTKTKNTLKCHLKKTINRNYSGIQIITPHENNIQLENETLQSEVSYKLIKMYIENLREQRFTVQNVVNFITEHDPSISHFNAMHATRIFLENAQGNEILRMDDGNYIVKTSIENSPCSVETHASSIKEKSTLKRHLKEMVNRNCAGIQTFTSHENNIQLENKTFELASGDSAASHITGFLETHLSGSGSPVRQDSQGPCNIDLDEKK